MLNFSIKKNTQISPDDLHISQGVVTSAALVESMRYLNLKLCASTMLLSIN